MMKKGVTGHCMLLLLLTLVVSLCCSKVLGHEDTTRKKDCSSSSVYTGMVLAALLIIWNVISHGIKTGAIGTDLTTRLWNSLFKVSIIKLEVAFVDPDKRIETDIRQIKKVARYRQQREVPHEGRELKLSDIVSCLQDNVDYFSCAKCRVGYFSIMNWRNSYIKLSGRVWRRASNNEGRENLVVTILVAAEGVHKLPTLSGPEELGIALQQMAFIGNNSIEAMEVFCSHGGINLEADGEDFSSNFVLV